MVWMPWVTGVVALVMLVGWWRAPLRLSSELRLPGADRPAGLGVEGGGGDVFAQGTLEMGPGRPGELAGEWPRFRGPRGDGIGLESNVLARTWPSGGPRVLWSQDVGEGFAGPVVSQGRVYLMDYDREGQRDALRCLSMGDGQEIWRYSYPMPLKRNHGLSRTVPTVAGGWVVAMGPKCHVVAVDAGTGRFQWGLDLAREHGTTVPPWYAGQCPWVEGDLVVLAPGGPEALLLAVELSSGVERWRTPNTQDWKMTHSSIAPLEVGGRRWLVYGASGGVVVVDAKDGKVAWQSDTWRINIAAVPTPVPVGGGRVFFTGGYNAGSLMLEFTENEAGEITAREVFRIRAQVFGATQHTPIWQGGHIYGIRADGQMVCLTSEGKVAWASGPEVVFGLGPLLMADGLLLAMSDGGLLSMMEAVPEGYRPLGEAQVLPDAHEAWAPLAMAGGRLLARDLNRMVCLDLTR